MKLSLDTFIALYALSKLTYAVQHNPNCPKPYLVRLVGKGKAQIDGLPYGTTSDILGYGSSLQEAAFSALRDYYNEHPRSISYEYLAGKLVNKARQLIELEDSKSRLDKSSIIADVKQIIEDMEVTKLKRRKHR